MMERRYARGRRHGAAGDHDVPYAFGFLPSVDRPYPFRLMQFARLLFMRGRRLDGAFRDDQEGRYQITVHNGILWVERDGNTYVRRPMDPN